MSLNWIMLAPNANPPFHFLPHETLMHQTNTSVALNIESGKTLPAGDDRKKSFSSPAGTVFLTNQRVRSPFPNLFPTLCFLSELDPDTT
jgi:hypothetical protein